MESSSHRVSAHGDVRVGQALFFEFFKTEEKANSAMSVEAETADMREADCDVGGRLSVLGASARAVF